MHCSILSCLAAYWYICNLHCRQLVGFIIDGLQCLLCFIVYIGMHYLLVSCMTYWQSSRPAGRWHCLLASLCDLLLVGCIVGFIVSWAKMPTGELHGLLADFMTSWQASWTLGRLHTRYWNLCGTLLVGCIFYWAACLLSGCIVYS